VTTDRDDLGPADPLPARLRWIARHTRLALGIVTAGEVVVLAAAVTGLLALLVNAISRHD
jgi:hypothetical protein